MPQIKCNNKRSLSLLVDPEVLQQSQLSNSRTPGFLSPVNQDRKGGFFRQRNRSLPGNISGLVSPGYNSIIQSARKEAIGLDQIEKNKSALDKSFKNKQLSPNSKTRAALIFGGNKSALR